MTVVGESVVPYASLAGVYDRWTSENDYQGWVEYLRGWFTRDAQPVHSVLDVCCGTGRLTQHLQTCGYQVVGIDRSEHMLAIARERIGAGAVLLAADLPDGPDLDTRFDAAVCTFDSLNYFVAKGAVDGLFRFVARSLRRGGLFVFDVNTRRKLEEVFGSSHHGDDLGDFAYVWRNRYDEGTRCTKFLITLFQQDTSGRYVRSEETHTQCWFSHESLRQAAESAGFEVMATTDDYSDRLATADSLREVWVLRRIG